MLKIDSETMTISMTRGDTVDIIFSAVNEDGNTYLPEMGDVLVFGVGKARNKDPLFQVTNEFGSFSLEDPTETEFNADKTKYFTLSDGVYTRCTASSVYSSSTDYYVSDFWDVATGRLYAVRIA